MSEDSPERLASVAAKIDALEPGPEMDARSAQVIGWEVLGVAKRFARGVKPGGGDRSLIPRFSLDPAAVFELEEGLAESEHFELYVAHLVEAVAPEEGVAYSEEHLFAIAHAAPEVRCRAALKASMKIPTQKPAKPAPAARRATPSRRPARQSQDEVELL